MNGLSRANRKPSGEYARRSGHFVNKGRHMNVCAERALMRQAGWYRRNITSCPSNDLLGQFFIGIVHDQENETISGLAGSVAAGLAKRSGIR